LNIQFQRGGGGHGGYNNYNRPRFTKNHLIIFGAGAGAFGVYYAAHLENVPISGRRRMIDVSPETELFMGQEAWASIKEEMKGRTLPESDQRVKLVKQIAAPIIKASGLTDLKWEFIVVKIDQPNAFVLPGGKVCVFTGILKLATDPNELATVLSHEIGHVVARHNAEKWSFARILVLGGYAARFFVGDLIPPALLDSLMYYGMQLPFSRKCESEADHIGLLLMSQACYHPEKAVDIWKKFLEHDKTNPGEASSVAKYLSTHPTHADRIEHIKELLPQANALRDQSHCEAMPRAARTFFG